MAMIAGDNEWSLARVAVRRQERYEAAGRFASAGRRDTKREGGNMGMTPSDNENDGR